MPGLYEIIQEAAEDQACPYMQGLLERPEKEKPIQINVMRFLIF